MRLTRIICAVAAIAAAGSVLAAYSYGRFAMRARGKPSFALPPADADTRLGRDIAAILATTNGQNGLVMLSDNLDAFAARALAARSAERSLDLIYYIWHGDLTGRLLAHEVIQAADRGVRVRVILDDVNAYGSDPVYCALDRHPQIEVRLFNPSRARKGALRRGLEMALRAFSATRRMHNKAWIADGRLAIVGGRNIGDEYFDAAERANYRDRDLVLMGPVVGQAEDVFDAYWNSTSVIPVSALAGDAGLSLEALRTRLSDLAAGEAARPYLDRIRKRVSLAATLGGQLPIHWTDRVRIVSDPPAKALGQGRGNWLMATLRPVIVAAQERLEITSPYFVPGDAGTAILIGIARKGVDVAVLTNSLATTDVAAVHGGYAPSRVRLLEGGVRLFELQPHAQSSDLSLLGSSGASLHTKAFTVDDRFGFIGSFNFDPRSASLNTEMGVLFEHPGLVHDMRNLFARETDPAMSYRLEIGRNGRLTWAGKVDGMNKIVDREPEVGWMRLLMARAVGFLPIQSQL